MKKQQSPHPQWATKHRRPGTELRLINDHYYLYEVKSVYDKEKHRARKITGKILGKITEENGFIESEKNKLRLQARAIRIPNNLAVREYGLSQFVLQHTSDMQVALQQAFPEDWRLILALAYCRLGWQAPLKNIPLLLAKSYLAAAFNLEQVHDKLIGASLHRWGQMRQQVVEYMRSWMPDGEYALIDATDIFCKSQNITYAHKGYNSRMDFHEQISLLYIYSTQRSLPIFYRIISGNVSEISTMKNTLRESGLTKVVLIGDKGFFSKGNIEKLNGQTLKFILPMKRNNAAIEYDALRDIEKTANYFKYQGRFIYYHSSQLDNMTSLLFYDGRLKENEKTDYLNRIITHPESYSHEVYREKLHTFGTIAMATNLREENAESIYTTYKSRCTIEQMFDWLKNTLNADCSYMHSDESLQGWMFINHLTLQMVSMIYNLIRNHKLVHKYSVKDFALHLSHIKQMRVDDTWYLEEIISKTQTLLKKLKISIT